jgi:hypothetical protein
MTTKRRSVLLGTAAVLAVALIVWYTTMEKWAAGYQQTNASWRIRGLCTLAEDGAPIKDAEITAYFYEPAAFRHKLFNSPLKMTIVVARTDDKGHFELNGEGGHLQIKAQAKGYRDPESWEDWRQSAMNGVTRVDTNVVLRLQAASEKQNGEPAAAVDGGRAAQFQIERSEARHH